MEHFINLTAAEKNELFLRTSAKTKIAPLLLEKDFWVSWLLNLIFEMEIAKNLTFKGGTSLSKCYNIIHRFSEDIDITIDKKIFTDVSNSSNFSRNQFQKILMATDEKAIDFVTNKFQVILIKQIQNTLPESEKWEIKPDEFEPKNLRFYYPAVIALDEYSYIRQSILIEIGVRGEIYPSENKTVISYVENEFQDLLTVHQTAIKTLLPIRTFWEKITLLHAENNRPLDKNYGDRLSRHYYDVYQLIKTGIAEKAAYDLDLLNDVIQSKSRYFASSWSCYETAVPGTLIISPNERLRPYLENDYKEMRAMIFGDIPSLDEILASIKKFEAEINLGRY